MGKAEEKFNISTEIRAILLDSPEIKELVGTKIYPLVAPQDTSGDFIIYQRDRYMIERNKMAYTSQKCEVYINAICDNYDRSKQLALLIFEALDGEFSNPNMTIHLEDATEDYVDGKYIQVLLFSIV